MALTAGAAMEKLVPARFHARSKPIIDKVDDIAHGTGNNAVAQRIALVAFAIRIISAAIAFISQVILARLMGTHEYGIFVFVWTAMVIGGNISSLGFPTSVIRFIPQYRETSDQDALRGIHNTARWMVFAASSCVALLAYGALMLFETRIDAHYVTPFWIGVAILPFIALGDLMAGVSRAQGWAFMALAPIYLVRPLMILAILIIALLAGFDAVGGTALACAMLATAITTLGTLALSHRGVRKTLPQGPQKTYVKMWLLVSLPIFLVESFYFILTNADVLMVGFYMTPEDVAIYFAAVKVLALVHFVYFAVRAGAAQRFSTLLHSGETSELANFAKQTVHWTFWPSAFMALVMVSVGEFMLKMFGSNFTDGHILMFILCIGIVARSAVGPAESLLTMSGQEKICAVVYGGALAANLMLNIILIPRYGLMGAAIATSIAMTIEAILLSLTVYRRLGIVMLIGFGKSKETAAA